MASIYHEFQNADWKQDTTALNPVWGRATAFVEFTAAWTCPNLWAATKANGYLEIQDYKVTLSSNGKWIVRKKFIR